MKVTKLRWEDASRYEVCGRVEFQYAGCVVVLKLGDWYSVKDIWDAVILKTGVSPGRYAFCVIEADEFQEVWG